MGLFGGGGWGQKLGDFGQGLMGAQAAIDGDFGSSAGLFGGITKRRQAEQKTLLEQQQLQARMAALTAKGLDPQAAAILAGDDTAVRQSLLPQQQEEDVFTKSLRAAGIEPGSPEAKALYQQRVSTMASPAPNFLGDGMGGGRWVQPPAMPLPGLQGAPQMGAPAPAQGGPQPGTVEDGYQFMGGNPADPNAWKPVGGGGGNVTGGFRSNIPSGNPLIRPRFR